MEMEGEREAVAGGWPEEAAPMLPAAAFPGTPKALFLVPQPGSTACMGTGSGAWDGTSIQERATLVPEGPTLKVRCVNVI